MRRMVLISVILIFTFSCATIKESNVLRYIPNKALNNRMDSEYSNGLNYLKQGLPDKALESFRKSNGSTEYLFVAYGYTYLQKKNYNISKRNFERALEINKDNVDASIGLMLIFEELDPREEVFQKYSSLRNKFIENEWIKERYNRIKEENRTYYKELAQQDNDQSSSYIFNLKKAGFYSEKSDPVNIKIGQYYIKKQKYSQAAQYFIKIGLSSTDGKNGMLEIAKQFQDIEKYDEALLIYSKLQKENPDDFSINEKMDELKDLIYESNLPRKFKEIFFKIQITREDLAALIGYYFNRFLNVSGTPVIISDISDSFAQEYIIKLCSNKIMTINPDHSFGLYKKVNKVQFSNVITALLNFLIKSGIEIELPYSVETLVPLDISRQHYNYNKIIKLINMNILELDENGNFNPTLILSPNETMVTLKMILNAIKLELNE